MKRKSAGFYYTLTWSVKFKRTLFIFKKKGKQKNNGNYCCKNVKRFLKWKN